jgi:hypothetical protein
MEVSMLASEAKILSDSKDSEDILRYIYNEVSKSASSGLYFLDIVVPVKSKRYIDTILSDLTNKGYVYSIIDDNGDYFDLAIRWDIDIETSNTLERVVKVGMRAR